MCIHDFYLNNSKVALPNHKEIIYIFEEKVEEDEKQKNTDQASDTIIWIILGACVLLVVIIVIAVLFIVFRKKGKIRQRHETDDFHCSV
jgi:heme/copper-type cytochrome/quinol oxidase subunit 2